jgi:glycosyltransferase involved in cell wall biosynthesis
VHKIFQRIAQRNEVHVIYFEHKKLGLKGSYKLKDNIILHRPPTFFLKNMLLFYMINSIQIYSYINKIIETYNIEAIVTTNFLFAPLTIKAAKRNHIPIFFDLVDFQSYHINYLNVLPSFVKKVGSNLLSSILNSDIEKSDYVITTGRPLFDYVKRLGKHNLAIISNGVDTSLFNPSYDGSSIQKRYGIKPPIICFVGALEYWLDYEYIFHGLSLLRKKHPDLHGLFIGPSRYYGLEKIKQSAAKYKILDRIIFTGTVSYDKLPAYICASDICLLPFTSSYLTHCIIPMKLFEYLACGRPVVAVPLAGIKSVAKNTIFYAKTPFELSERIHEILTDRARIRQQIEAGLQIVKGYDWDDLANDFEKLIERVKSENKG